LDIAPGLIATGASPARGAEPYCRLTRAGCEPPALVAKHEPFGLVRRRQRPCPDNGLEGAGNRATFPGLGRPDRLELLERVEDAEVELWEEVHSSFASSSSTSAAVSGK